MNLGAGIRKLALGTLAFWTFLAGGSAIASAQASTTTKPNIPFIMGDDIGWMQVGVYHRGVGLGETPNINKGAKR